MRQILVRKTLKVGCRMIFLVFLTSKICAQTTTIKGFADITTSYANNKASFGFDEQDLFITSQLNDRFSFLGETVFKFDPGSHTEFSVSIERLILKYNFQGNHNLVAGKVHTPINYWNDTYHHGRVFFPTIGRPLLFDDEIIPLHTTGINFQGHDLGDIRFGYDFMIGNGIGSGAVADNDKYKSITAAVHIKPVDKMRIGLSYYNDVVSKGADVEGKTINWKVNEQLFTGSFAYFAKKYEVLAESTTGLNKTDTTGITTTNASYLYAGYKVTEKLTPYFRYDYLHYQDGEILFNKNNKQSAIVGCRYQINYLMVVKLEYQYLKREIEGSSNKVIAQFAIGF